MKAKVRKIKKEIPEKKFIGLELKTFLFETESNCADIINSMRVDGNNIVKVIRDFCISIRIPFLFNTSINEREAFKSTINAIMDYMSFEIKNVDTTFNSKTITNKGFMVYASHLYETVIKYLDDIYKKILNGDELDRRVEFNLDSISIKPIWR